MGSAGRQGTSPGGEPLILAGRPLRDSRARPDTRFATPGRSAKLPARYRSTGDRGLRTKASSLLRRLEQAREHYGGDAGRRRLALLTELRGRRLDSAKQLLKLHELLCFLRAYPDDARVLAEVETALEGFDRRGDLRRFRDELADTGIAGTAIHFSFFWDMAQWLARRWPALLSVDWEAFEDPDRLLRWLNLLLPYCETPALDMVASTPRQWIERLKGAGETDAAFLIRRFAALRADAFGRENAFESLDVPLRLAPDAGSPSRTRAKLTGAPVVFQSGPLVRGRPRLAEEIIRPPRSVRPLSPREGQRLIDLAREAMVTRHRDLDAFAHADRRDARLVDCGGGLQFACIGQRPERRLMFESVYGFLTLKNGVPIGYVLASSLFGSTEVAYNVFESFRGGEAAAVFGRVLGTMRHLFGSDAFSIDPYQLGHGNAEGLKSGAWWFYYKLGFRPQDPQVRRLVDRELRKMKADGGHRSSVATLERLSAAYMFLFLDRPRRETVAGLDLGNIGLRISRLLAERGGADREAALRACARDAAARLGVRSFAGWTATQRLWWERLSPVVVLVPGVERWKPAERRAAVDVIRAKGGRRESDYVRLFDAHPHLPNALARLAE